jgi:hypothetical protein
MILVPAEPMRLVLDEWIAAGGKIDSLPATQARYLRRALVQDQLELGSVDRLLIAIGQPVALATLYPPPPRTTRAGYTWAKPHPSRKLTTRQIQAAHTLHIDGGLSIRELGRQLYSRHGYATAKSCAVALSDAFRQHGLRARDRVEATVAASTTHGRAARADRAAYKRWHRETFGPWPSDRTAVSP